MIPENFGSYKMVRTLAVHPAATIVVAVSKNDNKEYACKFIRRDTLSYERLVFLEHECRIHSFLNHPNIIKFKEILYLNDFFVVITEYCRNGDLLDLIKKNRVSGGNLFRFIYQILDSIEYLHSKGYAHLDLKPDNIFVDGNFNLKLGDFGCSEEIKRFNKDQLVGTLAFIPPEILQRKAEDAVKCDIWSFGVMVYALATSCLPWTAQNDSELVEQIQKADIKIPSYLPKIIQELIGKCLNPNPKDRPTIEELGKMRLINLYQSQPLMKVANSLDCFKGKKSYINNRKLSSRTFSKVPLPTF